MINKITIVIILLITVWVSSNLHWSDKYYKSTIQWNDATGYYAYLPAIVIYHDLNFTYHDSLVRKYYNPAKYYDYRIIYNGKVINKYYAGTALCILPFFVAGHIWSLYTDYSADGFSTPYYIAVSIASIFYLFIGLLYVQKTLKIYHTTENVQSAILLSLVFGTNLFYYASDEPCLSHVYSFTFISAFVYHAKKYFVSWNKKDFYLCSLFIGFIILIRPINGIIIFSIPFIAGNLNSLDNLYKWTLNNKLVIFYSFVACILVTSIQLIIYKIQCGSFFIYSYQEEGFNWTNPQIANFLFSYKKGFFLYTPLAIFSLPGFVFLFRKNQFEFYSFSVFVIILVYVLSSWWNWWYGGSFSSRVLIDYYIFLAILFSFSYQIIKNKIRSSVLIAIQFILIIVCQIQTYQYRYYIIINDGMTKEQYWNVFLRVDKLLK
ncbi:MAG: hypothetical protein AB7G44_02325 [Bacteroidia bacterium]